MVAEVERVSIGCAVSGCALAAEEDVFIRESAVEVGLFQHFAARPLPVERARAAVVFPHPLSICVITIGGSAGSGRGLGQPVFAIKDILIGSMVIGIGRAGVVGAYNVSGRVVAPAIHLVPAGYGLIQRGIAAGNVLCQQVTPVVVREALPPVVIPATVQIRCVPPEQPVQRIIAELLGARAVLFVDELAYVSIIGTVAVARAEVIDQIQERLIARGSLQLIGLHAQFIGIGSGHASVGFRARRSPGGIVGVPSKIDTVAIHGRSWSLGQVVGVSDYPPAGIGNGLQRPIQVVGVVKHFADRR